LDHSSIAAAHRKMLIEMMLISGVGFSAVCGVALSGAVDQGAEAVGWCVSSPLQLDSDCVPDSPIS